MWISEYFSVYTLTIKEKHISDICYGLLHGCKEKSFTILFLYSLLNFSLLYFLLVNTSYHHRRKPEKVLKGVKEESLPIHVVNWHRYWFVILYHSIPYNMVLTDFFNDFISKNQLSHCKLVLNWYCTSKSLKTLLYMEVFLFEFQSIP